MEIATLYLCTSTCITQYLLFFLSYYQIYLFYHRSRGIREIEVWQHHGSIWQLLLLSYQEKGWT